MIEDLISSVEEPEKRAKLRALQNRWDKRMRGAGSGHNRHVLAKTFFWEHFHEVWEPTLRKCNALLNGGADTEST